MGYLSFILFLLGFFWFFNNKKAYTLFAIAVLSTGWFGFTDPNFVIGTIQLQHGDIALSLIFILLLFKNKHKNPELKGIKKALFIFVLFLAICILYDYFVRGTTAMQIFRTTRKTGYLAFFFLINSFSKRDYISFLKILVVLTLINSIAYILQSALGINYGSQDVLVNESGGARYANSPFFLIPAFVYTLYASSKIKVYRLYLAVFIIAIILAQSRGTIIAAGVSLFIFLLLEKKQKLSKLIVISVFAIVLVNVTMRFFPAIGVKFEDGYEQIESVNEMNFNDLNTFYYNGSFIFRVGVTYERITYVLQDFTTSIIGVGFIPDIDITNSVFIIGTKSPLMPTGIEQYNSADVFLPNIITRYGIVGSALFIYLIVQMFVYAYKNKRVFFGGILLSYLFSLLFISMTSDTFYNGQNYFYIFILLGICNIEKIEQESQ